MAGYQPDVGDVHVDALLTNMSIGYTNKRYIASQIFPIVPVKKQSDIVPRYDKDYWFREQMKLRGPGAPVVTSGFTVDNTMTFFCNNYALGKEIPDEIRINTDAPYDMDRDASRWLTEMVQLKWEKDWVTDFFATSKWGTDYTESAQWSDYAASDPIQDLRTMRSNILGKGGVPGNTLVTSNLVMDKLLDHPLLVERVKYTGGNVTEQMIAQLVRLDKVLVGDAIQAAALEGNATQTYSALWGKHALVLHVPPAPGIFTPTAGYTFVWAPLTGGGAAPWFVRRIRDDKRRKDVIEVHTYFDQKQIDADMGEIAASVIA